MELLNYTTLKKSGYDAYIAFFSSDIQELTEEGLVCRRPKDNVAVALHTIEPGTVFEGVTAQAQIPQGHKMALLPLNEGQQVVEYGFSIGHTTAAVEPGQWVHTHNMATNLESELDRLQCRYSD